MRITLDAVHTHAGTELSPGANLDLNVVEAEWLLLRRKAHRTTPADLANHANAIVSATADADIEDNTMRAAEDAGAHAGA